MDFPGFRNWLIAKNKYTKATISDMGSRVKRADGILPWYNDAGYQSMLEQQPAYRQLNCSVRSQIKRALSLYFEFVNLKNTKKRHGDKHAKI